MTTGSRKHATPEPPGTPAKDGDAGERGESDEFVDRLGDRLSEQHDLPPGPQPVPTPPPRFAAAHEASDVHTLPSSSMEDEALDFPPAPPPPDSGDAFAEFEDEIEGETTRIDDSHLLAEASTAIIEEAPAQPFLAVEKGNDHGREFVLQEGENGVGRGIDNDVILADVAVSRRHLKVIREGDTLKLRDLGSGNGSLVNGKKVSQVALVEGDRIELGETVLVVRLPGSSLAAVDPYDTDGNTDENLIGGTLPPPALSPTPSDPFALPNGPGYQPELTPSATSTPHVTASPTGPKGAIVLPKPVFLAIIAGAALLLAMSGAAVALVVIGSSGDDGPEETVTLSDESAPFDRGVQAYEQRAWDEAEAAFSQALQESGSDPRVNDYLQRTRSAREHQQQLARAREALEGGEGNEALSLASGIPSDSPLAGDAQELAERARAHQVDAQVAGARRALRGGQIDDARSRLEAARNIDPQSPNVVALAAEIAAAAGEEDPGEGGAGEDGSRDDGADEAEDDRGGGDRSPGRATRRSGTSLPRRVSRGSSATSAVISAYLAGRFDQAESLARTAARSASGSDRAELETLASRVHRFGALWQRIERAGFGTGVRQEMEQAMGLDRQIARNDRYRDRLRPRVVAAYLREAQQSRSNPTRSCTAVRHALSLDSRNAEARQMGQQCEATARGMMMEAGRAPQSRAEGIYRQVLVMVPSDSATSRQARQRLQALRRQQSYDEDE